MPDSLILKKESFGYSFPSWERKGARAFFTTKPLDFRFGRADRSRMFSALSVNAGRFVCPDQVHGTRVVLAGPQQAGAGSRTRRDAVRATDALMTTDVSLYLSVLTADCLPVFVFDPQEKAVAMIHAGWKGLKKGILSKTIEAMNRRKGSAAASLMVILGPCIRSCCYEVGREFLGHFPGFVHTRGTSLFMDLAGRARSEILGCGVRDNRIFDSRLCTCCSPDFHSFRREGEEAGRCLSAVVLL